MTGAAELIALLPRLTAASVGCVGDVMLDRFVCGSVDRVSPEAPVPVLRIERQSAMPGGAGNVVRNLAALGAAVRFVSVIGNDAAGRELRELLQVMDASVDVSLFVEADRKTTVKTRFIAASQHLLRADDEQADAPTAVTRGQIIERILAITETCPILILSDYAKGALAAGLAADLVACTQARSTRVIVDPKGEDFGRYRGADLITPNRRELSVALGTPLQAGEEAAGARVLRERYEFGAVLVTLGRDGMVLVEPADKHTYLPAESRDVFDVSGAGDTVVATLAAALAVGGSLIEAANLANIAAGIVVGKVGTAVARAAEINAALHEPLFRDTQQKILELSSLCERTETWRRQGLSIGFTNGCFDLLHPGHISLLAQAKASCDRLIIGLNTDASVTRLKGPGRPIQSAIARATVLASIGTVDAVVLFAEDTPLALVEVLRPDVLIKGADYTLDRVVGAEQVYGWGGRVLLVPLEPGYSTTSTITHLGGR